MAGATPESRELTIEQLAGESGVAFTTIRLYQQRGLLRPPARRGRVGVYDESHLARLQLIAELRSRGYSLAAIRELADDWQQGRTLTQVLGLEAEAAAVLSPVAPIELRPDELAGHFEGVELTAASMQRAFEMGLVAFDGDLIVVHDPAFLEVGSALARMGVPIDEVLDEYEHLRAMTDDLATRFTALFERNLWKPFAAAGMPADEVESLTGSLAALSPLAESIVGATLHRSLAERAAKFLDEHSTEVPRTPKGRRRRSPGNRAE